MKKIYIAATLALSLMAASCVKDLGTYDLEKINEVEITGIDTEGSYNVIARVDKVTINPELKGTIDGSSTDNYEYKWYVKGSSVLATERITISTEKNLDYVADLNPGSYILYFSVKDKKTELEWLTSTTLNVSTAFTTGLLLLGDESDGRARIDMIAMINGRDTSYVERVFDNTTGLKGAENLEFTGSHYNYQNLFLMTDDGYHHLTSSGTFELNDAANPRFFTSLNIKRPIKIKTVIPRPYSSSTNSGSNRGFITEDGIYFASIITGQDMKNPINRYSSTSKELFIPFPYMFCLSKSYRVSYGMFYDKTNERFVNHNSTIAYATACKTIAEGSNTAFMWDQSGLGRTLLYGENLFSAEQDSRAIMVDKSGNLFIYAFRVGSSTPTKQFAVDIDPSVAQGISKDSKFAFYSNNMILLYTVGSQLWGYNYNPSVNKAVMLKDFGQEISYISCEYISNQNANEFVIATYDNSSSKGTIRKFEMNPDANKIEMIERPNELWETTMKIKKVEWKNAN